MCMSAPSPKPAAAVKPVAAPVVPVTPPLGEKVAPNQFAKTLDYNAQNPAGYAQKTYAQMVKQKQKESAFNYRTVEGQPNQPLVAAQRKDQAALAGGRSGSALNLRIPGITTLLSPRIDPNAPSVVPAPQSRGGSTVAPAPGAAPVSAGETTGKRRGGQLLIPSTNDYGLNIPQ
jgi:hypothetical protein